MVHPGFDSSEKQIGDIITFGTKQILTKASEIEEHLSCPFSVFIHGDFNLDNIIYNHIKKKIHFIDLNRSCFSDFVQDISVFIISIFRFPVFRDKIRGNMNDFTMKFYDFSKRFSIKMNDTTFDTRLTFGLIRSLITSTRFQLNKEFAKNYVL